MVAKLSEELVAENPSLKEKLKSEDDVANFVTAVNNMGTKLADATQKKAEQETLDKAEAGIFALSAEAQADFDKVQLELKQAAEVKAKANAEAALTALTEAKAAGTWKDDGLTVAEKIAAMVKAND